MLVSVTAELARSPC